MRAFLCLETGLAWPGPTPLSYRADVLAHIVRSLHSIPASDKTRPDPDEYKVIGLYARGYNNGSFYHP